MLNNQVKVTIGCITYNQEKYIKHTLDGFVSQKTNFRFQILIHDDASTDNTALIIKEYQQKYPDLFVTILQEQNQHILGKKITQEFIFPNAKGDYLALCEGDDYWSDEYKLQKQFDIMEKNTDCSLCAHGIIKIKEDGQATESKFPPIDIEEGKMASDKYIGLRLKNWMFQTCSYFMRTKYIKDLIEEMPAFYSDSPVGDLPLELYLMTKGNLYYIKDNMACYRMKSHSSVTKRDAQSFKITEKRNQKLIKSMRGYNEYTENKYTSLIREYVEDTEAATVFTKAMLTDDYRLICSRECKKYYDKLNLPQKIFIRTMSIIPGGKRIGAFVHNKMK